MLYKLRVFLETEKEDVYRDIVIQKDASLEDLHNVIVNSFDFDGNEMASFYLTDDDLNQGLEIPLFNMDEHQPANNTMSNTKIKDVISEETPNLLYVYDFFNMWRFLIGMIEEIEEVAGEDYPQVVYAKGIRPEDPPEINFNQEIEDQYDIFEENENPFDDYFGYEEDEWN